MGSEKMVPFDVLSMGNISNFHLEPSKLHFFQFFKFQSPFISPKKNSSDYRVHGTQNDRLESRVSTQKLVFKNMHWVLRYWPKCAQIQVAKPNLHILRHFGQYLRTWYVFFKTDFCIETVSSSRSF